MRTSPTAKAGWLEKHASWRPVWNMRFITLHKRTISYSETDQTPERGCGYIEAMQAKCPEGPTCLKLWLLGANDNWLLRAKTNEEHEAWVQLIGRALIGEVPANQKLRGTVMKRSYWTHTWRSRFMSLEGVQLRYSEKEGSSEMRRYIIAACDRCSEEDQLLITAMNGDSFRIRLRDPLETAMYEQTMRSALKEEIAGRWQVLPPTSTKRFQLLAREGHSHTIASLGNAAAASGNSGPRPAGVLLLGGVRGQTTNRTIALLSNPFTGSSEQSSSVEYLNDVVWLSLEGEHDAKQLDVRPFAESVGARVLPPPRQCAACVQTGGALLMHGGHGRFEIMSDLWCIRLDNADELSWTKLSVDAAVPLIPPRFAHTMSEFPVTQKDSVVLVCGGFSEARTPSADVFVYDIATHTVSKDRFPPLPCARAGHGAIFVGDSLLLIGGTTLINGKAEEITTVDSFSSVSFKWTSPALSTPLPALILPAIAVNGPEAFVFGGPLRSSKLPGLFSLVPVGDSIVVTQIHYSGSVPRAWIGLVAHVQNDFLYVIGTHPPLAHEAGCEAARILLCSVSSPARPVSPERNNSSTERRSGLLSPSDIWAGVI